MTRRRSAALVVACADGARTLAVSDLRSIRSLGSPCNRGSPGIVEPGVSGSTPLQTAKVVLMFPGATKVSVISVFVDQQSLDLLLAADGDDHAFRRLIRSTEADVRRFCAWQGLRGADLDDAVQEAYVRAYRGLSTYRSVSTAVPWLLSIARRVCLDHAEKCRRDIRNVETMIALHPVERVVDAGSDLETLDYLARLPREFREAFVVVRVFGYSYDEAASIIGCPRGTVQSRVARARLALAAMITESAASEVS